MFLTKRREEWVAKAIIHEYRADDLESLSEKWMRRGHPHIADVISDAAKKQREEALVCRRAARPWYLKLFWS
jgi:hypothetical protein